MIHGQSPKYEYVGELMTCSNLNTTDQNVITNGPTNQHSFLIRESQQQQEIPLNTTNENCKLSTVNQFTVKLSFRQKIEQRGLEQDNDGIESEKSLSSHDTRQVIEFNKKACTQDNLLVLEQNQSGINLSNIHLKPTEQKLKITQPTSQELADLQKLLSQAKTRRNWSFVPLVLEVAGVVAGIVVNDPIAYSALSVLTWLNGCYTDKKLREIKGIKQDIVKANIDLFIKEFGGNNSPALKKEAEQMALPLIPGLHECDPETVAEFIIICSKLSDKVFDAAIDVLRDFPDKDGTKTRAIIELLKKDTNIMDKCNLWLEKIDIEKLLTDKDNQSWLALRLKDTTVANFVDSNTSKKVKEYFQIDAFASEKYEPALKKYEAALNEYQAARKEYKDAFKFGEEFLEIDESASEEYQLALKKYEDTRKEYEVARQEYKHIFQVLVPPQEDKSASKQY